jgi:class 3 adenylate cyclase/uncharacterized protein (DUF427 family)
VKRQATATDLQARFERGADYRIRYELCEGRVRVHHRETLLADSRRAVILRETRLPPVFYFPAADVHMELLRPSALRSHCPFRGNASYWHLEIASGTVEDFAWSYQEPYEESTAIEGFVAFFQDQVSIDISEIDSLPSLEKDPTIGFEGNPLLGWLLQDAWQADSPEALIRCFAEKLQETGVPLLRLWVLLRTIHPLLVSTSFDWRHGIPEVLQFEAPHGIVETEAYLRSPLQPILDGAGGVRRRLDVPDPVLDFAILQDLLAEGCTDYVAMPMLFSDGQINVVTMAAYRQGGFTTNELGHVYEALPLLSRLLEVFALRQNALNILNTYLGQQTGGKVLRGLVRRGDGEDIYAVIWFCDLRDSTVLAANGARREFLDLLNAFFDAMGGAVLDHGGEVLRFIGDAALGIFPIEATLVSADVALRHACTQALAAARDASQRMSVLNAERREQNLAPLGWGIGLHVGEVTFGNIGTPSRLEFTVIGPAANEAARIEGLTRELGQPILASEEFARYSSETLPELGRYPLRGVVGARLIHAVPVPEVEDNTD